MQFPRELRRPASPSLVPHNLASMKCSSQGNCDPACRSSSTGSSSASMKCSSRGNCDTRGRAYIQCPEPVPQ